MKLDLRFSDRPLEDLLCQAVAALVFQRPHVTESVLSGLNEKMGGTLADLEEKGIWTGAKGENVLLASQGTIGAEKILLHGLGQRSDWDVSLLSDGIMALGSALDKIEIKEFGIEAPQQDYPAFITIYEFDSKKDFDDFNTDPALNTCREDWARISRETGAEVVWRVQYEYIEAIGQ